MLQRPWPILILAAAQLLAPFVNVLMNSRLAGLTPLEYVNTAAYGPDAAIHGVLLLAVPLANAAFIFLCRAWSLAAFITLEMGLLAWNYHQRSLHPETFPFWAMSATNLANLLLVAYFLLPAVRRLYMQPRLRWWESKPRYLYQGPIGLVVGATRRSAEPLNVSEGGLFMKTTAQLGVGDRVGVTLECQGEEITLLSHVVHAADGAGLYGVEFEFETASQQKTLRRFVKALRRDGVPVRQPKVHWWLSLSDWLRSVKRDPARALVPTLPEEVLGRGDKNRG